MVMVAPLKIHTSCSSLTVMKILMKIIFKSITPQWQVLTQPWPLERDRTDEEVSVAALSGADRSYISAVVCTVSMRLITCIPHKTSIKHIATIYPTLLSITLGTVIHVHSCKRSQKPYPSSPVCECVKHTKYCSSQYSSIVDALSISLIDVLITHINMEDLRILMPFDLSGSLHINMEWQWDHVH